MGHIHRPSETLDGMLHCTSGKARKDIHEFRPKGDKLREFFLEMVIPCHRFNRWCCTVRTKECTGLILTQGFVGKQSCHEV
ncbi:hypothetical protein AQUCO_00700775v1 [Aquilegia coerulea]|uniref:Uncharacterized protein n=1 Tax=Aquilegia coerulea TaxID=218851 RepID=A0A2G5ELK9_AQUCA|nr:hypothetical protein AQUCO_00700775v1 [Aquilegia coerulea]